MKISILFAVLVTVFSFVLTGCSFSEDPLSKDMRERNELVVKGVKNVFDQLESATEEERDTIFKKNDGLLKQIFSILSQYTACGPVSIDPLIHDCIYRYSELGNNIECHVFWKKDENMKESFYSETPLFSFVLVKQDGKIAGVSCQRWRY